MKNRAGYDRERYLKRKEVEGYKLNGINRQLKKDGKKKCGKCNEVKDISCFYKPPNGKRRSMCAECDKKFSFKKSKEQWSEYYFKTKDRYKERHAKYRGADIEHFKKLARDRAKKNYNPERAKRLNEKMVQSFSECYLKKLLYSCGYSKEQIEQMPILLELKKLKIVNHRIDKLLKQKQNEKAK